VDDADIALRNLTYGLFVELGRAPSAGEVAERVGITVDDVTACWRRLHEAHAIVLDPDTDAIRMANPFSAVPTPYVVVADGRRWFANCAWDAFGICAALGTDGRIETSCHDCGDPIEIEVRDGRPDDESLLFHCLVPAARWWDDIGFT
jgi:hypothetical protein